MRQFFAKKKKHEKRASAVAHASQAHLEFDCAVCYVSKWMQKGLEYILRVFGVDFSNFLKIDLITLTFWAEIK